MTLLLVLIGVLLVFIFGSLLLVIFVLSQSKPVTPGKPEELAITKPLPFKWKYVTLPLLILLVTVVMVLWFYGRIPEEAGSRFSANGEVLDTTTRATLVIRALLPQVLLTVFSFLVAWGVTRVSALARYTEESGVKLENLLLVMGNMIALPQIVLAFTMLNTFGYNAYQVQILPLWVVIVIVMVMGAAALGAFFISIIRKVWVKGN